ncbi:MAG: sensor domain-containing diguanylate cyclase, partial [Acidobacteriota bacterium]|nr:sensor domain-containing diguanylate cyclase [Acidobacteriota bacterium]
RVFAIIERECRKIFDLDLLFIALVDRETRDLHLVYHRRRDNTAEWVDRPLGEGVASWVAGEKRAIRVDDLGLEEGRLPFSRESGEIEVRSLIAVPLIVEDEVIGVLSVQSRRARAYDDHQLSVLMTVAQQAAVAIENARNYEMATVDSLTGLCLRDYFFRRLHEEFSRATRYRGTFALLMIDLDGFKEINDTHGHLVGDRYLKALGVTIRSRLRSADIACRYGGDEFCLLLPETDLEGASVIAERLRSDVAALALNVDSLTIRTTVSIGVAIFPDHHTGDLNVLLRKADEALYRAKKHGRDRVEPFAA